MTCCFAICLPNVSLAAADTRVGIHHDGQVTTHDGPHPLSVDVSSLGRTITFAYRYRKIRKVADGWAVCAGDFSSASAVLDLLRARNAIHFTQAWSTIRDDAALLSRVQAETGIAIAELSETIVIGAPVGSSAKVWTLGLRPDDPRTSRAAGAFAINWPHSVPIVERQAAETRLKNALQNTSNTPLTFAKAMADVIATAARHASDAGPYVQIGMTLPEESGNHRSLYFEGLSSELETMSETTFRERIEVAA